MVLISVVVTITVLAYFIRKITFKIPIDEMPSIRALVLTILIIIPMFAAFYAIYATAIRYVFKLYNFETLIIITPIYAIFASIASGLITQRIMNRIIEKRRQRNYLRKEPESR